MLTRIKRRYMFLLFGKERKREPGMQKKACPSILRQMMLREHQAKRHLKQRWKPIREGRTKKGWSL
jgi:hypothetical protein